MIGTDPPPRPRRIAPCIALPLLCLPVLLWRLGTPPLADPDEGRNAEVAREMLATGDLITPHLNEARYLDKPPAFFWMVAASFRLLGPGEASARLPAALAALGLLLLVCRFADRHLGRGAAWIAGAALVLSPLFLIFARMVIFDMPLTLCATFSAMAAFEAMEGGEPGARAAGPLLFAAAGIGTLIKGPISLILPLLVAAAWALVRRRPALLLRLRPGIGLAIYAAFVLPWLALVSARNPGYLEYALLGENLARLGSNLFETARPIHFYLKIILPGFFPWILYLVAAAARRAALATRSAIGRRATIGPRAAGVRAAGARRTETFALVWAGAIILFFSLVSSKRPAYILPLAAPVALLSGGLWSDLFGRRDDPGSGGAGRVEAEKDVAAGSILVAAACLGLAALLHFARPDDFGPRLAGGTLAVLLSERRPVEATAAALLVAALAAITTRRSRRPIAAFLPAVLASVALAPMAGPLARSIEEGRSARPVSRFLESRLGPSDVVICFEEYRPGLTFYLKRPVDLMSGPGRTFTSNYIKMHIDEYRADPGFHMIEPDAVRRALLAGRPRLFLLAPRRAYDDLRAQAGAPLRIVYEDRAGAVFVRAGEGA